MIDFDEIKDLFDQAQELCKALETVIASIDPESLTKDGFDYFLEAQSFHHMLCAVVNEMLWPFLSEYERTVPI
jgi:hypothetical protein